MPSNQNQHVASSYSHQTPNLQIGSEYTPKLSEKCPKLYYKFKKTSGSLSIDVA